MSDIPRSEFFSGSLVDAGIEPAAGKTVGELVNSENTRQWFNISSTSRDYNFSLELETANENHPDRVSMSGTLILKREMLSASKIAGETTLVFLTALKFGLQCAVTNNASFEWVFCPTDIGGKMKAWGKKYLASGIIKESVTKENVAEELARVNGLIAELALDKVELHTAVVKDQEKYCDVIGELMSAVDKEC